MSLSIVGNADGSFTITCGTQSVTVGASGSTAAPTQAISDGGGLPSITSGATGGVTAHVVGDTPSFGIPGIAVMTNDDALQRWIDAGPAPLATRGGVDLHLVQLRLDPGATFNLGRLDAIAADPHRMADVRCEIVLPNAGPNPIT